MQCPRLSTATNTALRLLTCVLFGCAFHGASQTPDAFHPGLTPYPGQQLDVASLAIEPDGEVLIGGSFDGPNGDLPHNFALYYTGGTGTGFAYGVYHNIRPGVSVSGGASVAAIACQTNGGILIAGLFDNISGYPRNCLARFLPDRNLDLSFNPGASNSVSCMALQPDGEILVGGAFTNLAGAARSRIGRLLPSGAPDTAFNPGADSSVNCLAVQPDGKILVGGTFLTLAGQSRHMLGRLNSDGSLDTTFDPSPNGSVNAFIVQPDGKIIVGGNFSTLAGAARNYLGRLNPDGTVDTNFVPDTAARFAVNTLTLQTDGRLLVGGGWQQSTNCFPLNPLARLNSDGSADFTFAPCVTMTNVQSLALQKDGAIVVGGNLTTLVGQPRSALGRLINTSSAAESLTFDSSTVTWLRSGTSTEIWRATFELSTDGTNWISLGVATRILGGWQLTSLAIPTINSVVRARGFAVGGNWFVETTVGLPVLTSQPVSLTNNATTTATFSIAGYGGSPLSYQWLKTGAPLSDGGKISGAQSPNLTLTNVLGADAGSYSIILSNSSGSITSSVANLTVLDPVFTTQPVSYSTVAGQNALFTVSALGTSPLQFQWLQNGTNLNDLGNITGSQTSTLLITNVTGFNAGNFQAVVSNVWGSVTSSVAALSVIDPWIYTNPVSQSVHGGQSVTLGVLAAGNQPLRYQWLKNGANVPDATNSSLTLPDIQGFAAGSYDVVVSDSFGSVTSATANVTVTDPFITSNPTNQFLQLGQTAYLAVTAGGGSPLAYQWLRSGSPVPGATNASLIYINAQSTNAGNYSVVINDAFGSLTSSVAAVTINAAMADSFNPVVPDAVSAMAIQPDGKILLGFNSSLETYGKSSPSGPLRFNADGTPDSTFSPGITNLVVNCLAIQTDGKIVVGGTWSANRNIFLSRLNSDGSVDSAFTNQLGSGPNGVVYSLATQADGKLLIGGFFSSVSGQSHQDVARLNGDGSLDTNFNASVSGPVYSLAVQPDGAIVVGGSFNLVDGQNRNYVGRLNSDGSLATSFNASANSIVYCLAIQADNRIVIGGAFTSLNGQARNSLARLNLDGTLDTTFNPNANYLVYSIIPQVDGRILVGGKFATISGLSRNYIARLNADGSLDFSFNPGAGGPVGGSGVYALALQPDGAILAGGQFTNLAGLARTNIGRLFATGPATQSVSSDGSSTITWLRGGTSPEVGRTTFEFSDDGINWTNLGVGQRMSGGWQLPGLALPTLRNLRARGFLSGGQSDASSYFVQSVIGPPTVDTQPLSRTNKAASTATFFVVASGDLPLSYQWCMGGSPLTDSGKVSGVKTPVLTLTNVFGFDSGGYSVIISNSSGSITSLVANLTVLEPLITRQPSNQIANAEDTMSFSVTAIGSEPISYEWRKNGINIPGANSAMLTLSNLSTSDVATYSVLVSTPYGSALSSNATLNVNLALPDMLNPGAGDEVRLLVPQSDGRILVGYSGTTNGGVSPTPLVRLKPDGSVDAMFNPSPNSWLYCMTLQTDGKIVVGGTFQAIAGQTQPCIARLNSDGSLDGSFRPAISLFDGTFQPGLYSLLLQPDGKILAGGFFDSLAGGVSSNLCRLNVDGSCDTNFSCNPNDAVRTIAMQSDGAIIIGGDFTAVNGQPHNHIARLTANGSPDPSFNPGTDNHVFCLVVQPDDRILVAGQFTTLGGVSHNNLGRINPDGSLDTNFTATANNNVESLALQADGKIIVGGFFSSLAGVARSSLGRLNPNGTCDTTFFPSLSGLISNVFTPEIQGCALQPDGSLLLGGAFRAVDGQPRASLARLAATEPTGQYLSSDSLSITWLRAGMTPEVWRTTFETSPDGTNWTMAGPGTRINGGWRLTGLALPPYALVRARGFTGGNFYQGSGWFVESIAHVLAPPTVVVNDSTFGLHANQFTFNINAVPGQVLVIEASMDLVNWQPIQTNLVIAGTNGIPPANSAFFNFVDPQATLFPHRLYRARLYQGPWPTP